ncbi:MAG: histidine phosphatase family protein [Flavonifractor plautii]
MLQNALPLQELHHVLLSHYHYDHCSDAGALSYGRLIQMQTGAAQQPLHFYGLPVEPYFERLTMEPYTYAQTIGADDKLQIGPFCCTFHKTAHPVECLAVKVKCGQSTLVYTADGAYTPQLAEFAEGADLLIAECDLYAGADGARAGHMTSTDVAQLGRKVCARHAATQSSAAVWGPSSAGGPGEGPVERRSAPGTDTDDGGTASPETGGECALMEFQLVLVRHGYSLGNEKSLFSGWSDVPLTERGRRELRELRQVIRYPRTGRYFSSDLSRCRETFQELYGPHIVLDGLRPEFREICFGSLENRPGTQEDFMHFFRAWLAGHPILDVETYKAFRRRVLEAVAGLMRDCLAQGSQSATVVTHSGLIKTAVTALNHWGPEQWPQIEAPNGLGYILTLSAENGLRLSSQRPLSTCSQKDAVGAIY